MGEQACKISSLNSKYSLRYHRKSVAFWCERAKSCTRGLRGRSPPFLSRPFTWLAAEIKSAAYPTRTGQMAGTLSFEFRAGNLPVSRIRAALPAQWSIGLVVGASGSGKTRALWALFGHAGDKRAKRD